jgi:hypothetical protein
VGNVCVISSDHDDGRDDHDDGEHPDDDSRNDDTDHVDDQSVSDDDTDDYPGGASAAEYPR